MLTSTDIMAAKIMVQLGLAEADAVSAQLRELDAPEARSEHDAGVLARMHEPGRLPGGVVDRMLASGALSEEQADAVQERVDAYELAWARAIYVHHYEREHDVAPAEIDALTDWLEARGFAASARERLLEQGAIDAEADARLTKLQERTLLAQQERMIARYRKESFAGVARPIIEGSRDLDLKAFRVSLFRERSEEAPALPERPKGEPKQPAAPAKPAPAKPAPVQPAPVQRLETVEDAAKLKRLADYELIEVLGRGGMGVVFLGCREGVGEFCAVKVMLQGLAGEVEQGRFQREIELTARVEHENVIWILDHGQTPSGLSYMVVPALAGQDLREALEEREGKGLEPAQVVRVLEQVLAGLQACHDAGVIHRDMKPENVFVLAGEGTHVRVMDLGLGKLDPSHPDAQGNAGRAELDPTSSAWKQALSAELSAAGPEGMPLRAFQTTPGEVVGSPAYIAPESVALDPISYATDVYSLGVMLFELLTGRLPLQSETAQGFLGQHLIAEPSTLSEVRPEVAWPPALEALLARMLSKTSAERPTCAAILAELDAGLREEIASVGPRSEPEPVVTAQVEEAPSRFKGLLGWIAELLD